MRDANDLIELVKKIAIDVMNASNPCDFCYGKVTSESPLKITLEQKITLNKNQLVLTRRARRLKNGEKVVLIRKQGGQKYLILDRVVDI